MKVTIGWLIVAASVLSAPVSAHHSYAMFDRTADVALSGTVTLWLWANPHTQLTISAPDDKGQLVEWIIEGGSPQVLRNQGWTRDIVKAGDQVTVHMYPLRDGSKGGQLVSVAGPDGQVHKASL